MKRLFICYTPLHALIAMRIVELEKFDDCVAVYICFQKSNKHDYYFSLLSKTFVHAYFLTLKHTMFSDVFRLLWFSVRFRLLHGASWELFSGNIKHFHSRFLMLLQGIKKFNTFDDGSGNVCGAGYFYDQGERKEAAIVFSLLGPRLLYKNITHNINKHYTIYDSPNVFSPCQKLTLLNPVKRPQFCSKEKRVVYLANAFSESGLMTMVEEEEIDREILDRWAVTDTLLHPRAENIAHLNGIRGSLVRTHLIAEDYVLGLVSSGADVTVIGVNCTALLNLIGVEGLKLINFSTTLNTPENVINHLLASFGVLVEYPAALMSCNNRHKDE